MKTNAIVRIFLFSLAILILLGILVAVIAFNMFFADGRVQFEEHEMMDEPVKNVTKGIVFPDEIRSIQIEWVAGNITIKPDENYSEILVQENSLPGSENAMVCKQSGHTLKIQFCEESMKFPSFGINATISKDLVITVPADWVCNKLEIDAAAAEVNVHNLQINEADFDGASGQCIFDNCNIVELDIDTASGNVSFSGTLDVLDCDAASADCTIEVFNTPRSIDMDTASGNLVLILPPDSGFTCHMDTMSGSFDTDFEVDVHHDTHIHGDGACRIDVSAMSGDVNICKGVDVQQTNS